MVTMTNDKIRIKLRAYDYRILDKAVAEIVDSARNTGANIAGPILCLLRFFFTGRRRDERALRFAKKIVLLYSYSSDTKTIKKKIYAHVCSSISLPSETGKYGDIRLSVLDPPVDCDGRFFD